jgi:hypothetical protein
VSRCGGGEGGSDCDDELSSRSCANGVSLSESCAETVRFGALAGE